MTKGKKGKGGIRQFNSPLSAHRREGKQLIAPAMQIPNRKSVSWLNDRLADVVWAALVHEACPRTKALEVFRRFCIQAGQFVESARSSEVHWDITLTAMSLMPEGVLECAVEALDHTGIERSVLSPLLLLEDLPARDRWEKLLQPMPEGGEENAWESLAAAIAETLDHQCEASTDIRWMTVMFKVMLGKVHFRKGEDDEFTEELRLYPDKGNMQHVRPRIRAMEIAFRANLDGPSEESTAWVSAFWKQTLRDTVCMPLPPGDPGDAPVDGKWLLIQREAAHEALTDHWAATLTTTAVDARHDAAFGLAFYALACLTEIAMGINARVISGRLLIRTLTELRITLAYLAQSEGGDTWTRFRSYGSGQAKLALLKYEMADDKRPTLVANETLKALANEDFYQEFVNIDLGSWSGSDLRKMAEQSGTKDDYDRFYGWTSTFVHGQWPALRDAVMATCLNPLHRAHRVPMPSQRKMESCVRDAMDLVNGIFATLDDIYPGFTYRFPKDMARTA